VEFPFIFTFHFILKKILIASNTIKNLVFQSDVVTKVSEEWERSRIPIFSWQGSSSYCSINNICTWSSASGYLGFGQFLRQTNGYTIELHAGWWNRVAVPPTTWKRKQIKSGANMEAVMPLLLHPFRPKTMPIKLPHSSQNSKHTKGKIHTWFQDGLSKLNLYAWSCQLQITPKYCKN